MKETVYNHLKTRVPKICVLATATKIGQPHLSIMRYVIRQDLEVILSTHEGSRKWKNLQENPNVALAFGTTFDELYIQMAGTAQFVIRYGKLEKEVQEYFSENKLREEFSDDPNIVYLVVKPRWVRITDFSVQPRKVDEINL